MGELGHIPPPHPILRLAREIEAAAVSTLDADLATMADGSLGVVTREVWKMQPGDDPHRDYGGKMDLPAIAVYAENVGMSDGLTCGSDTLLFALFVGVVTEDASTTVARRANLDIQAVAVYALMCAIRVAPHSWIETSGVYLWSPGGEAEKRAPEQRDARPERFQSIARIPIHVEWVHEEMVV